VHDENAWSFDGIAPHAGLAGSGYELIRLLKALWGSNLGNDVIAKQIECLVDPKSLPVGSPANAALMGWRQGGDYSSEVFSGGMGFGHMGFTGCAFWIEETGVYHVFITNRICSERTSSRFKTVRRKVFSAITNY
jgi:hypothetical protein